MNALADDPKGSAIRTVLRCVLAVATAFGLKWSAEQVAIVQVAAEAVIQAFRQFTDHA